MFDIKKQLEMFDKLKYDGCESAMSKERAFSFYIPVSLSYFKTLSEGKTPEETKKSDLDDIKTSFYAICEHLKNTELSNDFLENPAKVADFYRHRGKIIGLDTSFINDSLSGEEIFRLWVDAYWQKVEPLLKNPALGEYMFASKAKDSEMFWCFLSGSASYLAIETAYRYGIDPVGIYREATLSDPLSLWTYRDEAYLYQKWRDDQFMQEIADAKNILALGAGGMPEIRRTGYLENAENWRTQHFTACDSDPRIDFDFLMDNQPEAAKSRIDYHHLDIKSMFEKALRENRRFDLVYIKGVLSFMTDMIKPVIETALMVLEPDGKLLFDLQLSHFAMIRDSLIFGWGGGNSTSKIKLLSTDDALSVVRAATDALGLKPRQLPLPVIMKDPFYGDDFGMNVEIIKL